MKTRTYDFRIISPCFCGGASPVTSAEIRVPSIRGQLRWWFRTLGGFKSLGGDALRDQESQVFGTTSGNDCRAGKLILRVRSSALTVSKKDCQAYHKSFSDGAYLLFPIQSRTKNGAVLEDKSRAVIEPNSSFVLETIWRGNRETAEDIHALISIFAQLGSLGFRGRRAMGALTCESDHMSLEEGMSYFSSPHNVTIRSLGDCPQNRVVAQLGAWLRGWRSHGRTQDHQYPKRPGDPPNNVGFKYAKNDHDIGYGILSPNDNPAFRPSLGLPIIQRTKRGTRKWEWDWDQKINKAIGRFASPVILRPHLNLKTGVWQPLVIFAESHKWPEGKSVFIDGRPCSVSNQLYEAMKQDPNLRNPLF